MLTKRIFTIAILVFFAGGALMAQNFKYIGASKCKMCHVKPATGEQYNVWLKGPHAGAMKTLASEESKKIASELGIADPTTDPACIKCHSTVGSVDKSVIASAKMDMVVGRWWELTAAVGATFIIILAWNIFGDRLRDALDPKLRNS